MVAARHTGPWGRALLAITGLWPGVEHSQGRAGLVRASYLHPPSLSFFLKARDGATDNNMAAFNNM